MKDNNKLFPNLNYKIMSIGTLNDNNLLETKIYTNAGIGILDLKCSLLDVYKIKSSYITTNVIKRNTTNIKINWIIHSK